MVLLNARKPSTTQATSISTGRSRYYSNGVSITVLSSTHHQDSHSVVAGGLSEDGDTSRSELHQPIRITPIQSDFEHHTVDTPIITRGVITHYENGGTRAVLTQKQLVGPQPAWIFFVIVLCLVPLRVVLGALTQRKHSLGQVTPLSLSFSEDGKVAPLDLALSSPIEGISRSGGVQINALTKVSVCARRRILHLAFGRWCEALELDKRPSISPRGEIHLTRVEARALSEAHECTALHASSQHLVARAPSFSIAAASLMVTPTFPCPLISPEPLGRESCLDTALCEVNRLLRSGSATGKMLELVETASRRRQLEFRSVTRIQRVWRARRRCHEKSEPLTQIIGIFSSPRMGDLDRFSIFRQGVQGPQGRGDKTVSSA